MLLKCDIELTRFKNEEYVIKLADINSLYQEVCDRNMILEKISKYNKLNQENEEFSSKKYFYCNIRNHLENFLTSGNQNDESNIT